MKKLFILLILGAASTTALSARHYDEISDREGSRWGRNRGNDYDNYDGYVGGYDNYDSSYGYPVDAGYGSQGYNCCPSNQGYSQKNDQYRQNQPYQQQGQYSDDQQKSQSAGTSDQEINNKLQDTLGAGWFSKGYENVNYQVNNGNVTLRGTVSKLEDKNKIEESVRKIEGVKQVNNQIVVSEANQNQNRNQFQNANQNTNQRANDYSDTQLRDSEKKYPQDFAANPQDRQLNARIRDKLGSGWFSRGYDALIIRTTNGLVIITGSVENPDDAKKVTDRIREIEGVRGISNQLNIKNR